MSDKYLAYGHSYTKREVRRSDKIRAMSAGDDKDHEIKWFEVETGKEFPKGRPIRFGINHYTAHMSSL